MRRGFGTNGGRSETEDFGKTPNLGDRPKEAAREPLLGFEFPGSNGVGDSMFGERRREKPPNFAGREVSHVETPNYCSGCCCRSQLDTNTRCTCERILEGYKLMQ